MLGLARYNWPDVVNANLAVRPDVVNAKYHVLTFFYFTYSCHNRDPRTVEVQTHHEY